MPRRPKLLAPPSPAPGGCSASALEPLIAVHEYLAYCAAHDATGKYEPECGCRSMRDRCRHCGVERERGGKRWALDEASYSASPPCVVRARSGATFVEPPSSIASADYPGHVYFIASGPFVKIGWAIEPARRLLELATGNPVELVLLGSTPGTRKLERALHLAFATSRVQGEWFRRGDALDAYIREVTAAAPADRADRARVA